MLLVKEDRDSGFIVIGEDFNSSIVSGIITDTEIIWRKSNKSDAILIPEHEILEFVDLEFINFIEKYQVPIKMKIVNDDYQITYSNDGSFKDIRKMLSM